MGKRGMKGILKNKKGDEKYYIIISLILGLLVLGLCLYYIFHEYFSSEEVNLESCRQSIILRNSVPDLDLWATTIQFKDKYPLKCRNEVINIDYKDTAKAEKTIADAFVSCWYLMGNGNYGIFPAATFSIGTSCMICSRIHIDGSPDIQRFYTDNPLSIKRALANNFDGKSYFDYLQHSGNDTAFHFFDHWATGAPGDEGFNITDFKNNIYLGKILGNWRYYILPDQIDVNQGDLFLMISSAVLGKDEATTNSLLFFQDNGGESINQIATKTTFTAAVIHSMKTCDSFESIPA
jgi:hypothetical protein